MTAADCGEQYVYVIAEGPEGLCKVGVATDCEERLRGLQTGNGRKLILCHSVQVEWAHGVEKTAHRLLRDSRVSGEWFAVSVLVAVEAVNEARGQVTAELERMAALRRPWTPPVERVEVPGHLGDDLFLSELEKNLQLVCKQYAEATGRVKK